MSADSLSEPDKSLGEEIEKLRQTFARVVIVALALLYFALTGLTTAMARVDSGEAEKELAPLRDVTNRNELRASYVFSRQIAELPENPGAVRSSEIPEQVATRLEALAKEWFSVRFEVLGTTVNVDLRLIAPLLPFLVALVVAYLWVTHRKIAFIEASVVTGRTAPDWDTRAFRRHPHLLFQVAILVTAAVQLIWLLERFLSLRRLVADDVQIDYGNAVVCVVCYMFLYVSSATQAINGAGRRDGSAQKLRRLISSARERLVTGGLRLRRGQLFAGAALVLLTLLAPTAKSCDDDPKIGYDYLTDADGTLWFNGSLASFTDYPMRPLYLALLIVSAIALARVVLPRPFAAHRVSPWARRSLAIAIAVSYSTAFLTVCSICFFGLSGLPRGYGDLAAVVFWIAFSIRVWRARARPLDRARRWETIWLVLLPLASTFGLQAGRHIYSLGLIGVPMILVGSFLQLRIYREAAGRTEAPSPPTEVAVSLASV